MKKVETTVNPEISIIMPAYNVDKYIGESLDSIHRQTFTNWECIIVDDGSSDKTLSICNKYAKKDSRFHVVHKDNGGVASARNVALQHVNGKYIAFVDPDDKVEHDFLKTLYELIERNSADIAQISFSKEFTTFKRKKVLTEEERIIEGEEILFELLKDKNLPSFLWNKIFRREVITGIFPEGKVYEDFFALTSWIKNISRIVLSPYIGYHYRMRKGSITATKSSINQICFLEAASKRARMMHELMPERFSQTDCNAFLYENYVKRAKQIARNESDPEERLKAVKIISRELNEIPEPDKEKLRGKSRRRAALLKKDPEAFIKAMRKAHLFDFHGKYCNACMYEK